MTLVGTILVNKCQTNLTKIQFTNFSCYHGWLGPNCTECVKLPGCKNGYCTDRPNTCICENGWKGFLCDKPDCG